MQNCDVAASYIQQLEDWKTDRLRKLTSPDGWLSLCGFGWLKLGMNRIGGASDNDIVVECKISHLGEILLTPEGQTYFYMARDIAPKVGSNPPIRLELFDDKDLRGKDSVAKIDGLNLFIINREGRKAVRIKNCNIVNSVSSFALQYFNFDPVWCKSADWKPLSEPRELKVCRRMGNTSTEIISGIATFKHADREHSLLGFKDQSQSLIFFVFSDTSSGKETYKNARFIYADEPQKGKILLDFNKAHNPPSAFTEYANCPIAPLENRLNIYVNAGERMPG